MTKEELDEKIKMAEEEVSYYYERDIIKPKITAEINPFFVSPFYHKNLKKFRDASRRLEELKALRAKLNF